MGGVGAFGIVACVQEVTVTPGELLADADLIHYTMGASEKDEEEAIRKASDGRSRSPKQKPRNTRNTPKGLAATRPGPAPNPPRRLAVI